MVAKPPYQRDSDNRPSYRPGGRRPKGQRGRSLIPLIVFGAVALFIASREIPWLQDKVNGLISPAKQAAIEICRDAALNESPQPEFARIIRGGKATATQNGFVVSRLILGEISSNEGEQRVHFTCHVSNDGVIANLHRESIQTSALPDSADTTRPGGPPTK